MLNRELGILIKQTTYHSEINENLRVLRKYIQPAVEGSLDETRLKTQNNLIHRSHKQGGLARNSRLEEKSRIAGIMTITIDI